MKKRRHIYLLLLLYSLVSVTGFTKELILCLENDHVVLKSVEAQCSTEGQVSKMDFEQISQKCFDCRDFQLLFPELYQHTNPGANTVKYSSQKKPVPGKNFFIEPKKLLQEPFISSTSLQASSTGSWYLRLALRTVMLQL